jgi:predicted phage terminase large subunit-like protein
MTLTTSNSSVSERLKATATPGLFARMASKGKWRMGRHHALVDRELIKVAKGETKRLIVEMPPRHGKSEHCAKYFTAWYRGTFPERKVLLTSATYPLATKWSAEARDLLGEFGHEYFGVHLRVDKQAAGEWALDEGGETRAIGVGGSPFGFGFHLGIIDDYFGSIEQALSPTERERVHRWFSGTMRNRLEDEETGAIVILATRYHKDDLVGRLLKEQDHGGDQWRVIRLPALATGQDLLNRGDGEALWQEKWSKSHLESERRVLNQSGYPWMWDALYQQDPPDIIDSDWPSEYFADHIWANEWPDAGSFVCRVMAIDPSLGKTDKSDYSAIIYLAKDREGIYWVDADIQRRPPNKIAEDAIGWHRELRPHALGCETVGFQELMGPLLQEEAARHREEIWFCGIPADGEKKVRIRRLSPLLAKGRLRFRRGSPGTSLLEEMLKGFPSHKFKDGPDALEMAVRLCEEILSGRVQRAEHHYEEQVVA